MGSIGPASLWDPLRRELDAWHEESTPARLWLRDDDATEVTPPLRLLVELSQTHRVPVVLAVIPARADRRLAEFVAAQGNAEIAVHGFAHANRALPGVKAQEFTTARDAEDVLRELRSGRDLLSSLFGDKCLPLFVPPWNRISPEAARSLPAAGYRALSTFGWERVLDAGTGFVEVNTHLDIIDWRGTRGGRDPAWLAAELAAQLARARQEGHAAVGVLTHHLVHDDTAWGFLEALFAETARQAAVRWVWARELIAP